MTRILPRFLSEIREVKISISSKFSAISQIVELGLFTVILGHVMEKLWTNQSNLPFCQQIYGQFRRPIVREQNSIIFLLHLHFLDLSGSILGLNHVLFRSLIHTNWILFSTLLDHYFAQIRSEFAILRA